VAWSISAGDIRLPRAPFFNGLYTPDPAQVDDKPSSQMPWQAALCLLLLGHQQIISPRKIHAGDHIGVSAHCTMQAGFYRSCRYVLPCLVIPASCGRMSSPRRLFLNSGEKLRSIKIDLGMKFISKDKGTCLTGEKVSGKPEKISEQPELRLLRIDACWIRDLT